MANPSKLLAVAVCLLWQTLFCVAEPASLDTNFNCTIKGVEVKAIISLPDDSLIVGGNFTNVNGLAQSNLVRLTADGTTGDPVAAPNGAVEFSLIEPDGKILIGGSFLEVNGFSRNRIARLNSDGTLDSSCVPPTNSISTVFAIARQSDGKILMGTLSGQVFRLNSDGTSDPAFNVFTLPSSTGVFGLTVRNDGRILVGGRFFSSGFGAISPVYCLDTNGTPDTSFSKPQIYGASTAWVRRILITEAGKILIAGDFQTVNGISSGCIARLNADGSLDTTFSPGAGANASIRDIKMQSDGRIVAAGGFTTFDGQSFKSVARLNTDGSLDLGFDPGTTFNSTAYSISIQPDNKIVFGSSTIVSNRAVVRLLGGNIPTTAPTIVRQPVGKTVYEGTNVSFSVLANGFPLNFQWRINGTNIPGATDAHISMERAFAHHSGSYSVVISNSLGTVTSSAAILKVLTYVQGSFYSTNYAQVFLQYSSGPGSIYSAALAPDGNVMIGGYFTSINSTVTYGSTRRGIAKVSPDGANDLSFWPTYGVTSSSQGSDGTVTAIGIQPDGKILVGGDFYYAEYVTRPGLARYNPNGTLDSTFSPIYVSADSDIFVVQPDGKILVGGYAGGGGNYGLIRLTQTGLADPDFHTGLPKLAWVPAVALSGEKIIIGGLFTNIQNTIGRTNICRLNNNGSIDETFTALSTPNGRVITLAIQPNNKIVIGGGFSTVGGIARNYVARLNPDGTLDASFNPGSGANGWIFSIALQLDGKILISGGFSSFNGFSAPGLARLRSDGSLDTSFSAPAGIGGDKILVETNSNILVVKGDKLYRLRGDLNSLQSPASLTSSTITNGGLSFNFKAEFGQPYTLEHSTNLVDWTPFTNFVGSYLESTIQIPTNRPSDFFRAVAK